MRHARRWSDNDHHFGPITYAYDPRHRWIAIVLSSQNDEGDRCNLRFSGFGHTIIFDLPPIVKPYRSWVDLSRYDWEKTGPDGRKGYTLIDRCEYGFSWSDNFFQIFHGRQTGDSSTDKTKGYFVPWQSWRFVRHSFYGLQGEHVATLPDIGKPYGGDLDRFRREMEIKEATPTVSFEFDDFDGARITATTMIEEREWEFGEGRFKWLSWFRRPKISRSLDIKFSAETGKRKGSWKGGTIGHSIEMRPRELHEAAFRRYCADHSMKFVGVVS